MRAHNFQFILQTIWLNKFRQKGDLKINGKSAARFRLIPQPNIFDEQLDEASGVTGGVGNGGIPDHEPATGFTKPNKKRRIGKYKWFIKTNIKKWKNCSN